MSQAGSGKEIKICPVKDCEIEIEGFIPLEIQRSIVNRYCRDREKRILMTSFIKIYNF